MRVIYKCRKRVYSKLSHKTLSLANFRRPGAVRVYELPVLGVVTLHPPPCRRLTTTGGGTLHLVVKEAKMLQPNPQKE